MIAARPYRRRRVEQDTRPHWYDIPEDPDLELDEDGELIVDPSNYDRLGMMLKIDDMERAWRDLVNEYGFSLVHKARQTCGDHVASVTQLLKRTRESRQLDYDNPHSFDPQNGIEAMFF